MFIKRHFKGYVLSIFLITNFIIWYAIFAENRNELEVAFLDVGQGDAIFIQVPNGKQILIDGGSNGKVLRELAKIIPFYDRSIDMIVLTHPDEDHIGGLLAVLEDYKVDYVMESGINPNSATHKEFENIIEENKIKRVLARQGMNIPLCNLELEVPNCESYLEVLFPIDGVDVSEFETNTASVVLRLVHGENSFLFTGDSPQSIEKYLVEFFGNQLDVDVLKLGHHGSKTSNSEILLGFTSPEYVIASVGENNSYGHPHQEVLALLEQFEIDLFRTDEKGTIIFKSDGENLFVK